MAPLTGSRYPNYKLAQGPGPCWFSQQEAHLGNPKPTSDDVMEVTWAALLVNQVVSQDADPGDSL